MLLPSHPSPEASRGRSRLTETLGVGIAAWVLVGCTETPLDATLLEGQGAENPGTVSLCPTTTPSAGRTYRLISKSSGACLGSGTVTEIEISSSGATGYTVELYDPCLDTPEQRWQLFTAPFGEWFIRNEALDLNLDLEGGFFFDGTEALLYDPHTMSNQRFGLAPQADGDFQIRASLLLINGSCLESMPSGENAVTLQGCSTASAQLWFLSELEC